MYDWTIRLNRKKSLIDFFYWSSWENVPHILLSFFLVESLSSPIQDGSRVKSGRFLFFFLSFFFFVSVSVSSPRRTPTSLKVRFLWNGSGPLKTRRTRRNESGRESVANSSASKSLKQLQNRCETSILEKQQKKNKVTWHWKVGQRDNERCRIRISNGCYRSLFLIPISRWLMGVCWYLFFFKLMSFVWKKNEPVSFPWLRRGFNRNRKMSAMLGDARRCSAMLGDARHLRAADLAILKPSENLTMCWREGVGRRTLLSGFIFFKNIFCC